MTPPRVLVLTDKYPPHIVGGYEVACANVTEWIRGQGVPVQVITSTYGCASRRVDGHVQRRLHRPQDSANLVQSGIAEAADLAAIRRAITRFRPDVVYAWSLLQMYGTVHAVLAQSGLPLVFNIQDLWLPRQVLHQDAFRQAWLDAAGPWPIRAAKRMRAAIAGAFVPALRMKVALGDISLRHAVFGSAFRQAEHQQAGFATEGSVVIHNGVDVRRYAPGPRRRAPGLRLLTTGRLVHEKGVHTAIEAMAELAARGVGDVSLTIAGFAAHPWEYADGLRQQVHDRRLEASVEFRPGVDDAEMAQLYRDHDAFLFPSIGPEGFPMGVLEAMASGLCVIGTTTGGTAEVLEHEVNGIVFPPGDAPALASAVARIRQDRALAASLGDTARRHVCARFAVETIAAAHLAHLASVVEGCHRTCGP
jgi:glycogen synthase